MVESQEAGLTLEPQENLHSWPWCFGAVAGCFFFEGKVEIILLAAVEFDELVWSCRVRVLG